MLPALLLHHMFAKAEFITFVPVLPSAGIALHLPGVHGMCTISNIKVATELTSPNATHFQFYHDCWHKIIWILNVIYKCFIHYICMNMLLWIAVFSFFFGGQQTAADFKLIKILTCSVLYSPKWRQDVSVCCDRIQNRKSMTGAPNVYITMSGEWASWSSQYYSPTSWASVSHVSMAQWEWWDIDGFPSSDLCSPQWR